MLAKGIPWEHFYLGSLAISVLNTTFLTISHYPTRKELEEERRHDLPLPQPCVEAQLEAIPRIEVDKEGKSMDRTDTVQSEKTSSSSLSDPSVSSKKKGTYISLYQLTDCTTDTDIALRYALSLGYTWAFCFFCWVYSGR